MHYSNRNNLSRRDQVKVAVITDQMAPDGAQTAGRDALALVAAVAIAATIFWIG